MKYLEGEVKLPSKLEMEHDIEDEKISKRKQGLPLAMTHQLGDRQWDYFETLASEAKFSYPYLPVVRKIMEKSGMRRAEFTSFFKNDSVRIIDEETFVYVESNKNTFSWRNENLINFNLRLLICYDFYDFLIVWASTANRSIEFHKNKAFF